MPASSRPSVDLPAPDGPTTATRSPGSRSRSMPCRTSRPGDVRVAHVLGAQPVALGPVVGRVAVGRDADDADEAGERRRADLDLVEPGDQPVDGVGEHDDVERDRGHLAERGVAGGDEPAAPGERGGDRQDVGELGGREPDRAQVERAALGAVGLVEVGVDPPHALLAQAERLDRAAAVDRLADRARERRVGRALPEVPRRRAAQVPARADPRAPARRRGTGSAAIGLTQTAAATVSTVVTAAISVSGTAKRIVRASASTSAVVRETRSPVPARSTVESGSASTRRMKSSRSSANICSESTNEARRAKKVRIVCASRQPASRSTSRSTYDRVVPSSTDSTSRPRSAGPARPAVAAAACSDDRARERAPVAAARGPAPARAARGPSRDRQQLAHVLTSRHRVAVVRSCGAARGAGPRRRPGRPRAGRRGRRGRARAGSS